MFSALYGKGGIVFGPKIEIFPKVNRKVRQKAMPNCSEVKKVSQYGSEIDEIRIAAGMENKQIATAFSAPLSDRITCRGSQGEK